MAVKASRENSRVIEDNQIVRAKQVGELAEKPVFDPSGRRVEMKKARSRPVWKGLLRNQFWREIVMEIGDQHATLIIRI